MQGVPNYNQYKKSVMYDPSHVNSDSNDMDPNVTQSLNSFYQKLNAYQNQMATDDKNISDDCEKEERMENTKKEALNSVYSKPNYGTQDYSVSAQDFRNTSRDCHKEIQKYEAIMKRKKELMDNILKIRQQNMETLDNYLKKATSENSQVKQMNYLLNLLRSMLKFTIINPRTAQAEGVIKGYFNDGKSGRIIPYSFDLKKPSEERIFQFWSALGAFQAGADDLSPNMAPERDERQHEERKEEEPREEQ
ncbi:MAG: hypothetical protein MJ252_22465 [archaeon]|nr:hypothetical protein [archaeon]